jgi:hypothetical protein
LDGHNSHISVEIIDLAIKNHITLICLIPHSSHAMQPLDVGVFSTVKSTWRQIVSDYYFAKANSNVNSISKVVFPSQFAKLYEKAFQPHHATAGFAKTGLFPLNRDKIDHTRRATSSVYDDNEEPHTALPPAPETQTPPASCLPSAPIPPASSLPSTPIPPASSPPSTPISVTPFSNSTPSGINLQLSQARLVAASTPTLVVKMRGRDVLGNISQNLDFDEKSKFLTSSILNQLKINNARKENVNKHRVDSPGVGGKVLNEASSRAIVQAKLDKKDQQRKDQIERAEKATKSAEEKIKKMNEAIEKNKLKVQNLKTGVVTKSNKKRISKNDKKNSGDVEIESNVKSCRECSSKFDIKTSRGWLACENCINWFCSNCLEEIEDDKCTYC